MKQSMDGTTLISLGFTGSTMAYRELWEKYLEHSSDPENQEEYNEMVEVIVDEGILTKKEKENDERLQSLQQQIDLIGERNAVIQQRRNQLSSQQSTGNASRTSP